VPLYSKGRQSKPDNPNGTVLIVNFFRQFSLTLVAVTNSHMKTKENPCNDSTFVGNRAVTCLDIVGPDKRTLREKYLVGDPHDCPLGPASEMKKRGFVGIYLKNPIVRLRLPNSSFVLAKNW
jgi:hypothetical protein